MKKTLIRNMIIVAILVILTIPYNYFYAHYMEVLDITGYLGVIVYAVLLGVGLMLLDLSNRKINIVFSAFFIIYTLIDIYIPFYAFGPTLYLLVLLSGALVAAIFKPRK